MPSTARTRLTFTYAGFVPSPHDDVRAERQRRDAVRRAPLNNLTRTSQELVLVNAPIRDVLLRAAEYDLYQIALSVRAGPGTIVTFNLPHFSADALERYGVEAHHPDAFLVALWDLADHILAVVSASNLHLIYMHAW